MGDFRRQGLGDDVDGVPEHLVTVSPFLIDRREYSVGRYRAAVAAGFEPSGLPPADDAFDPECTYRGPADPSMDAFPLSCVPIPTAREVCAFEGGDFPSEA
jgi:formylglycine-generating enzyme required for sulfatase activity